MLPIDDMPKKVLGYRPDIDVLRAIAVLSILFFHLEVRWFKGGFVGVDIFFVISGFLITKIIKDEVDLTGDFNFKRFYLRRVRRLLPALLFTLFVTTILASILLSPAHLNSFGGSLAASLVSFSNVYFWLEADYFDVSAKVKPLLHTWSLGIEEQFYLIWPISLVVVYKIYRNRFPVFLIIFCFIVSLILNIFFSDGSVAIVEKLSPALNYYISNGRSTIFFLLPFRVFEFCLGAALVWIAKSKFEKFYFYDSTVLLGFILVGFSVCFYDQNMLFPSYYALVPCFGAALLIYSGSRAKILSKILKKKVLVTIGLLSYSLYLVHWPIIVFWSYIDDAIDSFDAIIITLISFVLACISYKYVESPIRYQTISISPFILKHGSLLAILLLSLVGLHMKMNYGWPWRVSSPVVFENPGDASKFHLMFYGGAGYPFYGPVNTDIPANVVLMGDSHARHFAEGIVKEWVEPDGLSLYMACGSSFLHLPNFTRKTPGFDWDNEAEIRMREALSYINNGQQNKIVILSHAWLSQMTKASIVYDSYESKESVGIDDIFKGIERFKKLIGDNHLVIIGEVPGSEHNLYDIFTRPIPPFFSDFEPKNYLTSPKNMEKAAFNLQMAQFSEQSKLFHFLDPFDVLCKNDECSNVDYQNRLIYSDSNHLSKYGSRMVVHEYLPELRQIFTL